MKSLHQVISRGSRLLHRGQSRRERPRNSDARPAPGREGSTALWAGARGASPGRGGASAVTARAADTSGRGAAPSEAQRRHGAKGPPSRREHKWDARRSRAGARARIWIAAAALGAAALLGADSYIRIVRISFSDHLVQIRRSRPDGSSGRWTTAVLNAPVVEGEDVRTGPNGEAEVQLECGSALRLVPDSQFSFPVLRLKDDGVRATAVRLDSGSAFLSLRRADTRDFHLLLPGGEVAAPHQNVKLWVQAGAKDAPASIAVLDGRAVVLAGGSSYTLKKKMRLLVAWNGQAEPAKPLPQDAWAKWSEARDRAFERAMAASRPLFSFPAGFSGSDAAQPQIPGAMQQQQRIAAASPPSRLEGPPGFDEPPDPNPFAHDAVSQQQVPPCARE